LLNEISAKDIINLQKKKIQTKGRMFCYKHHSVARFNVIVLLQIS